MLIHDRTRTHVSALHALHVEWIAVTSIGALALAGRAAGADCNGNGVDDAEDIAARFQLSLAPRHAVGEATSMVAADLDHDGDVDLAAGALGMVSVLRNRGDGTFEAAEEHAAPGPKRSIIAQDLNRDGSTDLVAAGAAVISVLLGKGDGGFQLAPGYTVDGPADTVLAADLDGDGSADLVTLGNDYSGPAERATIVALLNNGDHRFRDARIHDGSERLVSPVIRDLDGDGKPDLAVLDRTSVLVFFSNIRQPPFGTRVPIPLGETMVSLSAADLDGDGHADLAAGRALCGGIDCGAVVTALVNNLDRSFRAESYPSDGYPSFLMAEDLGGDGHVDLAIANGDGSVVVRQNTGQGTFLEASRHGDHGGVIPVASRAADLDGDGRLDILTASWTASGVSVLMNRGDGTLAAVRYYSAGAIPHALAVEDLDGDSRPDVAVLAADRSLPDAWVTVLINKGGGTLAGAANHAVESGPYSVLAADLDADGRLDVATPNLLDSVSVLLNDGGSFQPASHYPVPTWTALAAADLSGDGQSDLVVAAGSTISVLINRGDGTFHGPRSYSVQFGVHTALAVDTNRDGRLDVVGVNKDSLSLLHNEGAGHLQREVTQRLLFEANRLTALDLDGDGEAEILTANAGAGNVVLVRDGEGGYETPPPVVGYWPSFAADLDADGDLDLVILDPGVTSVFLTGADGTFASQASYTLSYPFPARLADLNEDGLLDLAAAGYASRSLSVLVLLNVGGGVFDQPAAYSIAASPASSLKALIAADLDLDGFRDLVAASAYYLRGEIAVLLSRGDGSFREALSFPVGGSGVIGHRSVLPVDVDQDGKPDLVSADVTGQEGTVLTQGITLLSNLTLPATSRDGDLNGVPDECEAGAFHRGDPNHDGRSDIADAIALLGFLFTLAPDFSCMESADANDDEVIDISDPVFLLLHLFNGRSPPPYPGPPGSPCGLDRQSEGHLGCSTYEHC